MLFSPRQRGNFCGRMRMREIVETLSSCKGYPVVNSRRQKCFSFYDSRFSSTRQRGNFVFVAQNEAGSKKNFARCKGYPLSGSKFKGGKTHMKTKERPSTLKGMFLLLHAYFSTHRARPQSFPKLTKSYCIGIRNAILLHSSGSMFI